jgi:hypothetical protein
MRDESFSSAFISLGSDYYSEESDEDDINQLIMDAPAEEEFPKEKQTIKVKKEEKADRKLKVKMEALENNFLVKTEAGESEVTYRPKAKHKNISWIWLD